LKTGSRKEMVIKLGLFTFSMVKREVIAALLDVKKAAILRVLLHSTDEMYLSEISEKSNVSLTSTFRILQDLINLDILQKRVWKTSKVYSCMKNDKVDFLKDLFFEEFDGVKEFVEMIDGVKGIDNVILHGSRKKGKANVLLIGQGIDTEPVEAACNNLREKGFELSYLTLTKTQYEQMSKMGLYSGEKKVLK